MAHNDGVPDAKRPLSTAEVRAFIASIPSVAWQWRPPEEGGVRRLKADEIAARIAKAFQEAGIEVRQ